MDADSIEVEAQVEAILKEEAVKIRTGLETAIVQAVLR